jgi:1-acyl-sn-glycerol-3-phosphate acyltransferase
MKQFLKVIIFSLKIISLIVEAAIVSKFIFRFNSASWKDNYVQSWSRKVLKTFGISIKLVNAENLSIKSGFCIVSNHISWIDIQVIESIIHCRFISTSEVFSWPVIGKMADAAGSLFIDLDNPRTGTKKIVDQMVPLLRAGERICFFPEATSTDGIHILPFKSNLFQSSISSGTPVVPVAIRYLDASNKVSTAPGFFGDMTLIQCMKNIFDNGPLTAEVIVLPAAPVYANKKELSEYSFNQINNTLSKL